MPLSTFLQNYIELLEAQFTVTGTKQCIKYYLKQLKKSAFEFNLPHTLKLALNLTDSVNKSKCDMKMLLLN